MKPLFIFVSLIAAFSIFLNFKLYNLLPKQTTFKVTEVIDGDTFKIVSGGEERRVRLIGVNAPEIGKCLSQEAKEKLGGLVSGKNVVLEDQFNDPYGRIMANVFIDGRYINKEMLSSGLGRMDYYNNPRREELKIAYGEGRAAKSGIFSTKCLSLTPPTSSSGVPCNIKGNIDDNTQKKIYFLPKCKNYSQVTIDLSTSDQWFCSEPEALKASFLKSPACP